MRNRLENGLAYSAVEYLEALRWRGPALAAHLAAIGDVDVDARAGVARGRADASRRPMSAARRNAEADHPGDHALHAAGQLSRPAGAGGPGRAFGRSGLPIGLQLIGRPFGDETLIALGTAFQAATDHHRRVPTLAMSPIVEIERPARALSRASAPCYALNGVDITLEQGEVLGLLGESGSGKSVTLRALLRMLPPRRSRDRRLDPASPARTCWRSTRTGSSSCAAASSR